MDNTARKPRLIIAQGVNEYMIGNDAGEWASLPVFKAQAPIDLVLAVTRHRNPDCLVYAIDPLTNCIRIH